MATNWDNLYANLPVELWQKMRHNYGRRQYHWTSNGTVTLKASEAELLEVYTVPARWSPLEALPPEFTDSIFIAQVGKSRFLVNTEGYSYCRYIAKLRIVQG